MAKNPYSVRIEGKEVISSNSDGLGAAKYSRTAREANTAMRGRQTRDMNVAVIAILIAGLPTLLITLSNALHGTGSPLLIWGYSAVYLLVVGLALLPHADTRLRGWGFLLLAYTNAIVSSLRYGLVGGGTLYLLWIPVIVITLIGARCSLISTVISLIIYASLTVLAHCGILDYWLEVHENPLSLGFWIEAGWVLFALAIPGVFLLAHSYRLQVNELASQRRAMAELAEAHTQLAAHDQELGREVAMCKSKLERALQEVQISRAILESRVRERTAELLVAQERLQVLDQLKDEFVANVSHELRTPITNIRLYHYLLMENPVKRESYMATLQRETERLERIVDNLLYLSYLKRDENISAFRPTDINKLVRSYVSDRTAMAMEKGLTLILSPTPSLPILMANSTLLERVLSVLLSNAFNYTPPGGMVAVCTQSCCLGDKHWVGFGVSDTGPGIPPDEQPHLFDRFFRGAIAHQSGVSGIGLGLAIAKEVVRLHGGWIEASSEGVPGHGASFLVWLPVMGEGIPNAAVTGGSYDEESGGSGGIAVCDSK